MSIKRTKHFKVQTLWPSLVNKQIKQVETYLKEIHFSNLTGSLVAKGQIKRKIQYLDLDGRVRKAEDRIQFEVALGELLSEPVPSLNSDLKQEYYLFQPRQLGENQAILEQGFNLSVWENESHRVSPQILLFLADLITNRGEGSVVIGFPVRFQETEIRPKQFRGSIEFNKINLPIASGEVKGVITYCSRDNFLREIEFTQTISILISPLELKAEQNFLITGEIVDYAFTPNLTGQGWLMELKLNYKWRLTEEKELSCLLNTENGNSSPVTIKVPHLIDERRLKITKNFFFTIKNLVPTHINLVTKKRHEKLTKKGVLLSAGCTAEVFLLNAQGVEIYQEFEIFLEELVDLNLCFQPTPTVLADLETRLVKVNHQGMQLMLDVVFDYKLRIYQNQVTKLVEEINSKEIILTKILVGSKSFSMLGENRLFLRRVPLEVMEIKARLIRINPLAKDGWLKVEGWIEAQVSYLDRERNFYEDGFEIFFQERLFWDKLNLRSEVEIKGKLDYNSYLTDGQNIFYKYLLTFQGEAFEARELKVATHQSPLDQSAEKENVNTGNQDDLGSSVLMMEGKVSLKLGKPWEIAQSRTYLSEFYYQNEANAVVIEGSFTGELEYWDDVGYLRKETVHFPFWRLMENKSGGPFKNLNLIPQLRRYSYSPVGTKPWEKGCVRIFIELELKNNSNWSE